MQIKNIFTDNVQATQAYNVPDSGGMIKLNDMESPYKLPSEMRESLGAMLSMVNINRYPNSRSTGLVAKVKSQFALPDNTEVMLGNGSDELIQIILMATARAGATVLSPTPSFVMYEHTAKLLGMHFVGVDLNADFSLDEQAFLGAIEKHQPAVIFLAYPNNPTGMLLDEHFVEKVIEKAPGLVVFDEAYTAYASEDSTAFIEKYEQTVLIRTLSKIGFAGIRLGYLAAQSDVMEQLEKVRMPYNINVLTQATARFMLDQMTYVNHCVEKIKEQKQQQYEWFEQHQKITVYPSETNFLLIRVENADEVFSRLRDEYKILVKNLNGYHHILDNILRITIGRKKENAKLREALTEILG